VLTLADFNRNAIRMGFLFVVYPSLVLMCMSPLPYALLQALHTTAVDREAQRC